VIRKRPPRSQIIEIPKDPGLPGVPSIRSNVKLLVFGLVAVVAVGATLLSTPLTTENGERTSVVDAVFTAMSAVAVTGLVVVDTQTHWNFFGQLIILILIQIGGLGFMVGAGVAFQLLRTNTGSLRQALLIRDSGPTLSVQEAVRLSKHIAYFTFTVEAVGWLVLTLRFWRDMPPLQAIWHGLFYAISGFCNAGFDLEGDFRSLVDYRESIVVNLVLIFLIQFGSLSFMVVSDTFRTRSWQGFAIDTKFVLIGNAILLLIGFLVMIVIEWNGALAHISTNMRPLAAVFQSVSGRTAGFATINFSETDSVTQFVWVALMMVGGASGSTAGGVKIATVFIVLVAILSTVEGKEEPQIFQRRVPMQLVFRAMSVIAFFILLHFIGTLLLAYTEYNLRESAGAFLPLLFETMSGLATVGLSTGITPDMSTAGKIIVCVLMFVGRLGPLTLAIALQRRQTRYRYRFPTTPVRIG
jgi:trk system potassium uptake protein